jgi:hypothetical protein
MSKVIAELLSRQRTLALYGLLLIAFTPIAIVAQQVDPRTIAGVNVWVKPAKFLFSIGLYAVTMAWYFRYVRPERRSSLPLRVLVVLLIVGGSFEVLYIGWQAAHGLDSHFNVSTPLYTVMYALMGFFATLVVGTSLPLAWEIARRPVAGVRADLIAAVVIGLTLTFILGGLLGGYMSSQHGHAVGAVSGHVPLFGWNRGGGDLRVAHFLGIHAQQAIPLLAVAVGAARERVRWSTLIGGAALYTAVTLAVFVQAIAGRAFLPA